MKRGRSDSLTGGTGDVNPQWLSADCVQTGQNATTTSTITLPIDPTNAGRQPTVIEVLKVFLDADNETPTNNTSTWSVVIGLTTKSTGMGTSPTAVGNGLSDPFVFAFASWANFGVAASTSAPTITPQLIDLTDGAGHGLIIATPKVYCTVSTSDCGAAVTGRVKILYRFKKAVLQEWIGLLQSQQSGN